MTPERRRKMLEATEVGRAMLRKEDGSPRHIKLPQAPRLRRFAEMPTGPDGMSANAGTGVDRPQLEEAARALGCPDRIVKALPDGLLACMVQELQGLQEQADSQAGPGSVPSQFSERGRRTAGGMSQARRAKLLGATEYGKVVLRGGPRRGA